MWYFTGINMGRYVTDVIKRSYFTDVNMSSFEFIIHKACYLCSYRRVTGLIITHQRAALFTARRQEMIEVLERSFFYLLTHPEVHSPHSEIPFQVIFRLIELVIVSIALHVLSFLQLFYCVISSFCFRL